MHLVAAQTENDSLKYRPGKFVVKWSALHFVAHFPSVQIAFEHRVFEKLGLQYDFGPILNLPVLLSKVDYNKHGFRSKFQIRYYVYEKRHWKVFVATEAGYNQATYKGYRTYYVNPSTGYNYYQFVATPSTYKEKNLALLVGFRFGTYRFGIEPQIGAIGRDVKFHNDSPGSYYSLSENNEKDDNAFNHSSRRAIEPTVSMRFCYIMR
jgi:hypothetical protein